MTTPNTPRTEILVGRPLLSVLEAPLRANLPVLLIGEAGAGKSEILVQAAERLSLPVVVLNLSILEPSDLVGMPVVVDGQTVYARPAWFPTDGEGLIILEELNRAETFMRQPALQLLTARELLTHKLPPGWRLAAAINPEEGDYQVARIDKALRSRFMNLYVRPDRNEWVRWAEGVGVHASVLDLARAHDRFLESVSPRTWKYVSDLLNVLSPLQLLDEDYLRQVLSGYLERAWVDTLILALETSAADLGLDMYAMLRDFQGSGSELVVHRLVREGDTSRLNELTLRLSKVVGAPELASLASRDSFQLESFESLLRTLPGDHRETLQHAFAGNGFSADLLDLTPHDLIDAYHDRDIERAYGGWLADDHLRHRALSLAWAIPNCLRRRADLVHLKRNNLVKRNLGKLILDLGERWAEPLVLGLKDIGIRPIAPRGTAA